MSLARRFAPRYKLFQSVLGQRPQQEAADHFSNGEQSGGTLRRSAETVASSLSAKRGLLMMC